MGNKKNKGVALIAVIVMIILFSSLILAVVLSATISIRRANYYKDKLIALEIAEAGIQKILYKMNYEKYDTGYYPWGDDTSSQPGETTIDFYIQGKKGTCSLKIDPDNTGEDTKILAIGKYKGREVKLSFEIRSESELKRGDKLNDGVSSETQGIPEAFNKHAIYASTVTISTTGTTVKGNITTTSPKPSRFPWSEATWVKTSNVSIPVLNNNYRPNYPSITIPSDPGTYDDEYDNSGNRTTGAPTGPVNSITDGVWWDGVNYHFGTDDGTNPSSYTRSNNSVNIIGAGARLRFGVNINNYFKSD
ncbi:MAG: pilus assembly PilX N-terminal domain-containing protein, partial [Candidatus Ratteibacteria bacterium]